jgi:hypothetical protein
MAAAPPLQQLTDLLQSIEQRHASARAPLFLQGDADCESFLALLRRFRGDPAWDANAAVPSSRVLELLRGLLARVGDLYGAQRGDLIERLVKPLVPLNLHPLRPAVLAACSLAGSAIPVPQVDDATICGNVLELVNGFGEAVVALKGAELRYPVVGCPCAAPEWVIDRRAHWSPVEAFQARARRAQLHAFMDLCGRADPRLGVLAKVEGAFAAPDLAFPVAAAALMRARDAPLFAALCHFLAQRGRFDHFVRSLAAAVRSDALARECEDAPTWEMRALSNCFLLAVMAGGYALAEGDFERMLARACGGLVGGRRAGVPPLARYIAKAVLVIGAYEDRTGATAIALFVEIVLRPLFRICPEHDDSVRNLKDLLRQAPTESGRVVVDTIKALLRAPVAFRLPAEAVEVDELYDWAVANESDLVQLVIYLSHRPTREVTAVQGYLFGFEHALVSPGAART